MKNEHDLRISRPKNPVYLKTKAARLTYSIFGDAGNGNIGGGSDAPSNAMVGVGGRGGRGGGGQNFGSSGGAAAPTDGGGQLRGGGGRGGRGAGRGGGGASMERGGGLFGIDRLSHQSKILLFKILTFVEKYRTFIQSFRFFNKHFQA